MSETRQEFEYRILEEMSRFNPNDAYHAGVKLDDDTYYAAMDRCIDLVKGKINNWTDLNPIDQ